nr:MAG TPA: hypothetical protein [Caudoviricetes sp.]
MCNSVHKDRSDSGTRPGRLGGPLGPGRVSLADDSSLARC